MDIDPEIAEIFAEQTATRIEYPGGERRIVSNSDEFKRQPVEKPSLTKALVAEAAKDPEALGRIAKRALIDAEAGDKGARDWVSDRLDGKVKQTVDGDLSGIIKVVFEPADVPE